VGFGWCGRSGVPAAIRAVGAVLDPELVEGPARSAGIAGRSQLLPWFREWVVRVAVATAIAVRLLEGRLSSLTADR